MSAANQPMTAAQQARVLLDFFGPNGEKWCQTASARDENGHAVNPFETKACRWCLSGAAVKLFGERRFAVYEPLGGACDAIIFNDSSPWEVVKAKLEEIAGK